MNTATATVAANPHHMPARISHDHLIPIPRRTLITTFLTTSSLSLPILQITPPAHAQNWGTRSFIRERFFGPRLSPEDAVARIRQTAEGLHALRFMLENHSWRYVKFFTRLKQSYLSDDMNTVLATVPHARRSSYIEAANELVDNMAELDYYIRTPKVYESYIYYEKTLKAIDHLVELLA